MMFSPVEFLSQSLQIVVLALLLFVLIKKRETVMLTLTGDSQLHGGFLDCIWWILRCGGKCTGEWTRRFSWLPCCPARLHGTNLLSAACRVVGLAATTVEIKNLVVGDLPLGRRGDFFIAVECAHNPRLVTSVTHDQNPKIVHFAETLLLRLRNSSLETQVRIVIKELKTIGEIDICEVYVNARTICEWAGDTLCRMQRIQMQPIDGGVDVETPAWILIEFDVWSDAHHENTLQGQEAIVRTVTQGQGSKEWGMLEFKHEYALVNSTGQPVHEPFEEDLQEIRKYRSKSSCFFHSCNIFVVLLVASYGVFRLYLFSCYRQFHSLTIASLQNRSFPINSFELTQLPQKCAMAVEGTGIEFGSEPCLPSYEQIFHTCMQTPSRQPRPIAFNELFEMEIVGPSCFEGVCKIRRDLVKWDETIIVGCIILLVSTCIIRSYIGQRIQQRQKDMRTALAQEVRVRRGVH
eukprot:TRINITY_DN74362_c0_g1_i1.p1 TRINITY_DN74362_c0_g1~~TRINITY_DN74362_c0_g1_i1.p1  ORF type:complete len:463 (-),score=47.52 TRINITY_DN74362_c0_g1_i1:660-2048(-)